MSTPAEAISPEEQAAFQVLKDKVHAKYLTARGAILLAEEEGQPGKAHGAIYDLGEASVRFNLS